MIPVSNLGAGKAYGDNKTINIVEKLNRYNPFNGSCRISIKGQQASQLSEGAATSQGSGNNFPPGNSYWGNNGDGGDGGFNGGRPENSGPLELCQVARAPEPIVLTLSSFAVTKLAYVRLTKAFREEYMKATGTEVHFRLTFGGSGVQARAVIDGLPADLVALALALDVDKIADAGLVSSDWRLKFPNNAVVCETTVAFVVRKGNPKNIQTWDDLLRPGVEVVLANPKTAGVARWIFLALWGHCMKQGDKVSLEYVRKVFENVVTQPRDAREASDVFFKQKVGDVLLTYENEVILTNEIYGPEKALPYIVPYHNIRIECPIALVDQVIESKGEAAALAATAFCRFLFTETGQTEFARVGFRTNPKVAPGVAAGQTMPQAALWSVDEELGGWHAAQKKFFDHNKILDVLQTEVGRLRVEKLRQQKREGRK
uniref:Sulfate-binding protein n=2 Tax=Polytomella parva TaxID=51329 RepID=A0A7S0VE21_9CHLO|nr:sulfate binding protein, component of chloroplast transporter (sulP) [Polytomella parva]|mmetsp:Transcript_33895/g.61197  ORF Transcript_33895/g.61197 Transcript_33895/m.61197 type:complete len:429 (+) Transcript_33895:61-1347(+)